MLRNRTPRRVLVGVFFLRLRVVPPVRSLTLGEEKLRILEANLKMAKHGLNHNAATYRIFAETLVKRRSNGGERM